MPLQPYPPIVVEALKALNNKQPIYRYEINGNTVTLWLYARTQPVKWTKPKAKARKPAAKKQPAKAPSTR